jgi:tRNA dimethylallyltransferase
MSHGVLSAVLIAGPTASGKSAVALALAEDIGGTVINADSMQVYRDLRVLTARPAPEEEARAPHRLYGHVDAATNYSTGHWLRDVAAVLDEVRAAGRVPVFVGGTGLYFKALTSGLAAVPPVPAAVRNAVRGRLQGEGVAPLYAELLARDPATAYRLMPNDRSRVARALEVLDATGRSLTDWHKESMASLIDPAHAAKIFLAVERQELVTRIETRFTAMLAAGALDEVRALGDRGLDPLLPAMKAHGVPWLLRHLRGDISLDQAAAGAIIDTRRYAKRQVTWFRNQMKDWPSVAPERAAADVKNQLAGAVQMQRNEA